MTQPTAKRFAPPPLDKAIARCLRKSADRRFQDMADLRIALLDLKEESDSGRAMAPAATRVPSGNTRIHAPRAMRSLPCTST